MIMHDGTIANALSATLWMFTGAIWWLCVHSMTLLFPLPGPWLPAHVAVPAGVIMGLVEFSFFRRFHDRVRLGRGYSRRFTIMSLVLGLATGVYLGWNFARGNIAISDTFVEPTLAQKQLSALVCGTLGMLANWGILWLVSHYGTRPVRLMSMLLILVLIMFAAVLIVIRLPA